MNNTILSPRDIYIEIDGKRAAVVENYTVSAVRSNRTIKALGFEHLVGTATGAPVYSVELTKVCVSDGPLSDKIDLYSLTDFSVVIVKPNEKIIFTNCEWDSISENASVSGSVIEKMKLTALKRVCVR